jgi:outer membrane protein TolC
MELPKEEDAVRKAVAQRADLQSIQKQVNALELGSKAASASGLPSLSLRASITQQNEELGKAFNKESQIYQLGLVLSWEGFSPFRARAKSAELRANAQELKHRGASAEEGVSLEVRSALFNAGEARERAKVQKHALEVAEEQARIARLAYREGVLTSVEAQDAELALTSARFNKLRAELDASLAIAQLKYAMGE